MEQFFHNFFFCFNFFPKTISRNSFQFIFHSTRFHLPFIKFQKFVNLPFFALANFFTIFSSLIIQRWIKLDNNFSWWRWNHLLRSRDGKNKYLSSSRRWFRELVLLPNKAKLRKNESLYNENFHPVFLSKSRLKTILFIQSVSQNIKRFLLDDDVLRWTKKCTLKKVYQAKMLQKNARKLFKSSFFARRLQRREGETLSYDEARWWMTNAKKKSEEGGQ